MSDVSLARGTRITQCDVCGLALPVCDSGPSDERRSWICAGCNTEYTAILHRDYELADLANVRPEPLIFDRTKLTPPAPEVHDYARDLMSARMNVSIEKRAHPRHYMIKDVPVQQLDHYLLPVGEPFMSTCRNISSGGIGLLNQRPVEGEFLAVDLGEGGTPTQVLVRVLRKRPIGSFYDIGGEFITRMAASTSRLLR